LHKTNKKKIKIVLAQFKTKIHHGLQTNSNCCYESYRDAIEKINSYDSQSLLKYHFEVDSFNVSKLQVNTIKTIAS
jgi:hypothetical protein